MCPLFPDRLPVCSALRLADMFRVVFTTVVHFVLTHALCPMACPNDGLASGPAHPEPIDNADGDARHLSSHHLSTDHGAVCRP